MGIKTEEGRILWSGLLSDESSKEQATRIVHELCNDTSPDDLCTAPIYWHLSKIIPEGRVVYDMGCAYAFQSYFFRRHKAYVGVDVGRKEDRISFPNSIHHQMTIAKFLSSFALDDHHFAICNLVGPRHDENESMVRGSFNHLFVFYPEHGDNQEMVFSASLAPCVSYRAADGQFSVSE